MQLGCEVIMCCYLWYTLFGGRDRQGVTTLRITSSNGNVFRVTWPLCGEFTGHRWIPLTKASDAELWFFLDLRLNKRLGKQSWGWWLGTASCSLPRHCNVLCFYVCLFLFHFRFYICYILFKKSYIMTDSTVLYSKAVCNDVISGKWNNNSAVDSIGLTIVCNAIVLCKATNLACLKHSDFGQISVPQMNLFML